MNGTISQIVALTCYGNAYLLGRPGQPLFPANSTCQFCEQVLFLSHRTSIFGKTKVTRIAQNPDSWFTYLKAHDALGIRLSCMPQNKPGISDRMSAGFVGGGGTWTMEVIFSHGVSEFWIARWAVGNERAPDKRIWRVTYERVAKGKSTPPLVLDLAKTMNELVESLNDIHTFALQQGLDGFAKCFEYALDTINTQGQHRHGYHQDITPNDFIAEEAAILLDACQSAWVFGAMGSWNDLGFEGEDQQRYDRVSGRLFHVVNRAIEQAATSTMKKL